MRLKTFYAKSMSEAMQMVRQTLGDEAVIIATREENGGKSVRVTAAIEQSDSFADPQPAGRGGASMQSAPYFEIGPGERRGPSETARGEWLQYDTEEDFEGQLTEELTDVMLRHVVPNDVMDQILSTAAMTGLGDARSALAAALDHLFPFISLPAKAARKAMMFVGPPGAGKTLLTAKMATQAVMNGRSVAVLTTDAVRAGGVEQLQAFTKLLKVPLHKAKTREQLQVLIRQSQEFDLVLIDTAGTNPHDPDDMARIARLIDAGGIEPFLAMTAGTDAEESAEIARSFALLGVQKMVATRLDVARRMGGILSAAQKGGMGFCIGSCSPKVTDGLLTMEPLYLADLLINPDRALRAVAASGGSARHDGRTSPSSPSSSTKPKTAGRAK